MSIPGLVKNGVVVPIAPLPEGAKVEIRLNEVLMDVSANRKDELAIENGPVPAAPLTPGELGKMPREERQAVLSGTTETFLILGAPTRKPATGCRGSLAWPFPSFPMWPHGKVVSAMTRDIHKDARTELIHVIETKSACPNPQDPRRDWRRRLHSQNPHCRVDAGRVSTAGHDGRGNPHSIRSAFEPSRPGRRLGILPTKPRGDRTSHSGK